MRPAKRKCHGTRYFIYGLKTINPSLALRIIIIIYYIIALLFITLNYYVYSVRVFAVLGEPIWQRFSTRVNIIINNYELA